MREIFLKISDFEIYLNLGSNRSDQNSSIKPWLDKIFRCQMDKRANFNNVQLQDSAWLARFADTATLLDNLANQETTGHGPPWGSPGFMGVARLTWLIAREPAREHFSN